ncbi:MAG: hypothetical protein GTN67_02755 [Hydrotalea flava]|uniref:hypothetical protein n=1 Tax=Hydrotalea TaxID=1004300 RepID=UPI000834DF18|nr:MULTISPECIES: hypothetical protein [Hydrotalea]RTL56750.1 MAG: hypothetical protein EKK39_01410 [Sphingobacteriales bacterium]MBY0348205.1 hypothetical protein [Hydrotalea flava]NIM34399.1 hypothetical protein [Hydrotalea flava]NIM37225.1 hypothetical protein [Hydrotalea flava]NIN02418.1 hypothetical protein [Hydrotalea flava]
MENKQNSSLVQLEKEHLNQLVSEVKETVATNLSNHVPAKSAHISAATVWHIQNQKKRALRQKLTNRWGL